ncbi:MAG TPA: GNAT family N-acetyltransferase [Gaiellaceae bacterium]|nr:GNAT family N-acetyltransferase [Gaiellaceae bacterium]
MIRTASHADVEALRALYEEFHAFHVRGVPSYLRVPNHGEAYAAELDRGLERLFEGDDATLLVAESERHLIGLAEVYLDAIQESPFVVSRRTATLQSLLVTEHFRGTGIGRRLVEAAERWATERGAQEMKAKTWEFPEGPLPFYETLGYRTLRRELVKSLQAHT